MKSLKSILSYFTTTIPDRNTEPRIQSSFTSTFLRRRALPAILLGVGGQLCSLLTPNEVHACACGCGVFEVGDPSMFPQGQGGMLTLEWDFQNQNHNWSGSSRAPAADNDDKNILTHFTSTDLQYFFNRNWGFELEVPVDFRTFITTAANGKLVSNRWAALGDIRIQGIYTVNDQSAGISVGLKLPTGDWKHNDPGMDIDRDSELGTGSTDLLVGGFFHHRMTSDDKFHWFVQAQLDQPMFSQDGYCPGTEIDAAAGIYYNGWRIGKAQIRPLAQIINSYRTSDSGPNAAQPVASGYERVMLSPGIEVDMHPMMFNASVDFPVYQYMTGDQLVAHVLIKVDFSYKF